MTRLRSLGLCTKATIAATVLAAVSLTHAQQRDPRAAAPAVTPAAVPIGTGVVSGVVTNEDGSRPVKFAYVLIIGATSGVARATSTDGDGKFGFASLPVDRYTVGASKPPYLGALAGARRPAHMGTAIALADGQKVTNVAVRLPMGAVITGVITDEKGQPAQAAVSVYQWRMPNGERVATSAVVGGGVLTDDRGRYRVYGLAPGDYLVAASSLRLAAPLRTLTVTEVDEALRTGAAPPGQASATANQRYAPVFFPGTARPGDALTVTLGTGEERSGVDFKLQVLTTARVAGVVTSIDGQLPQRMAVSLRTLGPLPMQSIQSVTVQPDGTFTFPSVMPGSYVLQANGGGQPSAQMALANVDVTGVDLTGIELALRPGLTLSGSVAYRGQAAPPTTSLRLPLNPVRSSFGGLGPSLQMSSDGSSFTVINLFPGSYYAAAAAAGLGADSPWTVDSIVIDGKDVTDRLVEISSDSPPKTLALTFTDRYQELSGQIRKADGTPASEHTIVVFPEDKTYWLSGSRRIVTVRPGTDGRFTVSGPGSTTLPPGRYLMAAVTDIDRDEQYDPAFLSALIPAAVSVILQPGEKKVQDLLVK